MLDRQSIKPLEKLTLTANSFEFDAHRALFIPRNEGPYAGDDFLRLESAFNELSSGGEAVESSYLRSAKNDNFKVLPIPLSGEQFILPALEELQGAFKLSRIESLVRRWSGDNTLSLDRASLQLNVLTDGNESKRHEHRKSDNRRWAFITMIHRSAQGIIFWTEEPTISPRSEGPKIMRDLKPGDSIFFDASIFHGSTLTSGDGMVARAAWGFS